MGRVRQAEKNIFFGYISNFIILVMGFYQNKVFIELLGRTLLGVNTLYGDILSMLSLAELGIGTALNFSLYKPVAENNQEKIKSYMRLYKRAYLAIAGVIAVIGLALIPFLPYIIKESDRGGITLNELTLYYLIFLFNTVSSYFVAYKYSLVNAQQKGYIQTNITTVTKIITVLVQIAVLFLTENFLAYLLSQAAIELAQKIFVSLYFNRLYPYLRDKDISKLTKEETDVVVTKTKALMFHKIGDVARLQTDSIIISTCINAQLVGLVGNYNRVITYASNFVNVIFNSVISGFGNLVATEAKEKQYGIFKVYRFFACWLYGFAAVGFWFLLTPFIAGLYLDESWMLSQSVLSLILIDFYFKGGRLVLLNFKTAAGIFEKDKFLPLIQGGLNLIISILGAKYIGIAGVYTGTVVSGILANLIRPVIIYRDCFEKSPLAYFKDSLKYIAVILAIMLILIPVSNIVLKEVTILTFILMTIIITVIYNLIFLLVFHRTAEFKYLWNIFVSKFKRA